MKRRWSVGWTGVVAGIRFRVLEGRKAPGDLRLQNFTTSAGWVDTPMALNFMLTDFFCENEDHLKSYRPTWRKSGAAYHFEKLSKSVREGWESAETELRTQRETLTETAPLPTPVRFSQVFEIDDDFDARWRAAEQRP